MDFLHCKYLKTQSQIEEKTQEIRKTQELLESVRNTGKNQDNFFQGLNKINEKVQSAASNFSTMVSASAVSAFNLEQTFGEQATKAHSSMTEIFQQFTDVQSIISQQIDALTLELQKLEKTLEDIQLEIKKLQMKIAECEAQKKQCAIMIAYYKKP